ncbi:hypothetical protein NLX83_26505 [Allokutzneria sp. A3M-2-11 16]|uniref:hypothetical protein n=1 Tax=Allokutzneria sp. A3M-2-11 16 TaxID=2962043 RepID=UPI0020B809A4|nr:hypothetical protein [Allokutzneria sp. A3M-2-11 16]MCP3802831.1 hypothetical protein [Allokutzneria sp. A3M-2-11 16]
MLKFVLGFAYLQVTAGAVLVVTGVVEVFERLGHGQRVSDGVVTGMTVIGAVVAALLWAAIGVTRGREWGRQFLIAMEALVGLISLIGVVNGEPLVIILLAMAGFMVYALCTAFVRSWFAYKAYHRQF